MRGSSCPKFRALLAERAIELRGCATEAEAALWRCLRAQQLGVRFRRQAVVAEARAVVDFLAPAARLVVELDGPYHARRAGADARRERRLRRLGFRVLRFSNEEVRCNLPSVLAAIRAALG